MAVQQKNTFGFTCILKPPKCIKSNKHIEQIKFLVPSYQRLVPEEKTETPPVF